MQMHNTSTKYPRVLSYLLPHIKANDSSEEEVLDLLQNWKGEHQLESSAPAAYYQLVFQVLKHTMNDEMSDTEFDDFMHSFLYLNTVDKLLRTENSAWWDNTSTDEVESKSAIVQAAFEEACVALSTRLGSNTSSWKWQDVHQVTHEHPLGKVMFLDQLFNVGPLVIDGGEEVPNKQAFWITDGVSYPVKSGPAMRIVIDFADVENSWSILPTGQSGNPFSTHYDDQAELFTKGLYRPQHMNRALIEKDMSRKVEFMTKP